MTGFSLFFLLFILYLFAACCYRRYYPPDTIFADGWADDTKAVQLHVDKAGEVNLPNGVMRITKPIIVNSNTHIYGGHLKGRPSAFFVLPDGTKNSSLVNIVMTTR